MAKNLFWFTFGNNTSKKIKNISVSEEPKQFKQGKKTVLEKRLDFLLKKYTHDAKTTEKILGELQIYRINLTIARETKNRRSERELTKNFLNFLKNF